MEQLVKIFSETGREEAINKYIKDGWKVVQMSSCANGWNYTSRVFYLTVLFERVKDN